MGKGSKRLKKCSASTSTEADHAVIKSTETLHKAKRESDDSETTIYPKKQKQEHGGDDDERTLLKKETEDMRNSFKEMVESAKKLVDLIPTKADIRDSLLAKANLQETALKESGEDEMTALKKEIKEITKSLKEMSEFFIKLQENLPTKADLMVNETPKEYECCFSSNDAKGNNERTIFVFGFDCSLSRDDTKNALRKHFGSCGEVTRVFVPTDCTSGRLLGFAFIDMKQDEKKALTLERSVLGGLMLTVEMAKSRSEYVCTAYNFNSCYPRIFKGCGRCTRHYLNRKLNEQNYLERLGIQPRTPQLDMLIADMRAKSAAKAAKKAAKAAAKATNRS